MKLEKIFATKRPIIGSLHFYPLLGYENFLGIDFTLEKAMVDLKAFEEGGVDAVIVENNYDLPHRVVVGHETVAIMTLLVMRLMEKTSIPMGISVLWNDYEAALSVAKVTGLKFVRVPVFVDDVRTSFGDILGQAGKVTDYRKKILADDIALFTDIQVKHATMLRPEKAIGQSANEAKQSGSDALIVTGNWTGDAPSAEDLSQVRETAGDFPIIIGSGADRDNLPLLLQFADGIIVSTSLKSGKYLSPEEDRNLKSFHEVVDRQKVEQFVRAFRQEVEK